jgi:hypothetical protein
MSSGSTSSNPVNLTPKINIKRKSSGSDKTKCTRLVSTDTAGSNAAGKRLFVIRLPPDETETLPSMREEET